ncbi:MAG: glutathione S-transferase family protein [Pseudomonadota bacterium]
MSELVFYTNPQSRGRIAHWMLEEVGRPYKTVWLDFESDMKDSSFLSINPMGKVPTLKHGDAVITEAAAICAYLADCFSDKELIPPVGHSSRADYYRWLFFAAGPLEMATSAKALNWVVPEGKSRMVGFGSYNDTLHALETALTNKSYICGDQFTAADVYVGSCLNWGMMFGTIEKRPVFEAYVERLNSRPAVKQTNQLNEEFLKHKGK